MEYLGIVSINDDPIGDVDLSPEIPDLIKGVGLFEVESFSNSITSLKIVVVGKTNQSKFTIIFNGSVIKSDCSGSFVVYPSVGLNTLHVIENTGVLMVSGLNNSTYIMSLVRLDEDGQSPILLGPYVRSVNGQTPDAEGDIVIQTGGDLSDYYNKQQIDIMVAAIYEAIGQQPPNPSVLILPFTLPAILTA